MKRIASLLAAAALGLTPALAQNAAPAGAPAPAEATSPAPDAAGAPAGGGGPLQAARAQCREQNKDIKGPAHRQAMEDCLIKAHPERAVQIKCQMDAMAQGKAVDKDARRAMVKDCISKAKG